VLTEQVDGQPGKVTGKDIEFAANVAKEIAREKGAFYVDQLHSMSGIKAHFETTGPEIWNDLGSVNVFIASLGSGATFIGTSKYLKSKNQSINCIAVEPGTASFLKTGVVTNPKHIIQGTGYGFLPTGWDAQIVDDIITVTDQEVEDMTKRLASEQSLYVGYSSGANVMAALKYLETAASAENVVTILCDSGYKYTNI
jgi:cysteine synthase